MIKYLLGIDAGVNTGVAFYNKEAKEIEWITTVDFWECIDIVKDTHKIYGDEFEVIIEDTSQNRPVFEKKLDGSKLKAKLKIAQNVGANKREATLMIEYFIKNDIHYITVRPSKFSFTKLNKETFFKYTKYAGKTNEHGRDAGMLVWGR